jgi:hypothetical protein
MLCLPRLYAPRRAQNRFSKIGARDQTRTGDVQEAMLTHVPLAVLAARSSRAAPPIRWRRDAIFEFIEVSAFTRA